MLSQTAEYALRAAACLARSPGQALTTRQIATQTQVPTGYLSKVLQALGRGGVVRSSLGIYGGFTLAVDPASLSLLQVIKTVDPPRRLTCCPLGIPDHEPGLCSLHRRLDQALAAAEEAFAKTTLRELLHDQGAAPLGNGKGNGG